MQPTDAHDNYDDPKSSSTVLVGLIGSILLLAVVVFVVVLFQGVQRREDERKLYAYRPQELADLQVQQLLPISEYKVLDASRGRYRIPIDQAISVYVANPHPPAASAPATMSQAASSQPQSVPAARP